MTSSEASRMVPSRFGRHLRQETDERTRHTANANAGPSHTRSQARTGKGPCPFGSHYRESLRRRQIRSPPPAPTEQRTLSWRSRRAPPRRPPLKSSWAFGRPHACRFGQQHAANMPRCQPCPGCVVLPSQSVSNQAGPLRQTRGSNQRSQALSRSAEGPKQFEAWHWGRRTQPC